MRMSASIIFSLFLLAAAAPLPAMAFSDAESFDSSGLAVDKVQYEIMVAERDKVINAELENGYSAEGDAWKDPIKLRKERLDQWQHMRSQYDPDSLPHKIEK